MEPVESAAELLQIEKIDLFNAYADVRENILRWPSVVQFQSLPIAIRGATLMIPGEDAQTEEFIVHVLPTVIETILSQNWSFQDEARTCLRYLVVRLISPAHRESLKLDPFPRNWLLLELNSTVM